MPLLFFFFQAEDGIRDKLVTGVQTCALPISGREIGGAPIALIVDDAVSSCRGPEGVAPRLSAARVQIGEPEAAGTRPFRRASVTMHRLAEALQAEVAEIGRAHV